MPDSKHMRWVDDYATDAKSKADKAETTLSPPEPAANDADGWQQYRRWITKAPVALYVEGLSQLERAGEAKLDGRRGRKLISRTLRY
jgi:hypothetical protein